MGLFLNLNNDHGQQVEVTDRATDRDPINDRDVRICQFNVGDTETKKIIIPLE